MRIFNPLATPQTVTVNILGPSPMTRTFTVPPRSGLPPQELGAWGLLDDFVVEVLCGSVCSSALTMWDSAYKTAHESPRDPGCRDK